MNAFMLIPLGRSAVYLAFMENPAIILAYELGQA